jgi:hypothetical protein
VDFKTTKPVLERLIQFIDIPDDDDGTKCWLWKGHTNPEGYGYLWAHGACRRAHRVAYELAYGAIPEGMIVRHVVCNEPRCVRASHLAVGDHRSNWEDSVRAGRAAKPPKLTEEDVRTIRRQVEEGTATLRELAEEYSVSQGTIWACVARRTYRWVDE